MRKILVWTAAMLLLSCLAGSATAEVHRISLASDETSIRLVDKRDDALTFEVSFEEMIALDVETPGGVFARLLIPGFHSAQVVGEPALPMMNRLFDLPFGATAEVEIHDFDSREIRLADLGIDQPLMPAQPSVSKSADPASLPFFVDHELYARDTIYGRELVRTVDTGQLRGIRIGRVEVAPVAYNPVAGTLTVHNNLRFTIRFNGTDKALDEYEMARTWSPFFEPIYRQIAGYRGEHETHPDLMAGPVKYVIVADRMFEVQLQPFIEWKTQQGFMVVELYTDEIGTSTNAIRDQLHYLYLTGTPEDPSPTFVLFVGDTAQIPAFNANGPTDQPYCDVSGDGAPEMYYGRFSARNTGELQPQIDKTLEYEKFEMPDPLYLTEVVLIAGVDSYWAVTHGNGQINYGTSHYFNMAHNILSHTYLYPASGSSAALIKQNVSDGVAFVNYTAHGSSTAWGNPSFTISDINNLQNEHQYCLALGNCCDTSTFSVGNCFAEHWLRVADKGAIGYIGGANSTYWDEDYYWGVGNGPIIGGGATYEQTGLGAYDGLFHDHAEAIDQWYVVQDAMIFAGNLAVQESGSSRTSYYWNIYNLMGDPSLNPHIGYVMPNTVSHADELPAEAGDGMRVEFQVTAVVNSYVGISKDGNLVGCGLVGENGTATIPCSGQGASGTALIVVTAHNLEPYMVEVPIGGTTAIASGSPLVSAKLERNVPNPFNPRTTFRLDLPAAESVRLAIYDIQGRLVRTLIDGVMPPGSQLIDWDGSDDAGRALVSGVYIARFASADLSESWKVVLAK